MEPNLASNDVPYLLSIVSFELSEQLQKLTSYQWRACPTKRFRIDLEWFKLYSKTKISILKSLSY